MRIPKVRAKKLKNLGKGLYECTDQRSTSDAKFEGSSGGGGYLFYGYENSLEKVAKNDRRLLRKASSIITEKKEVRPTRIIENG